MPLERKLTPDQVRYVRTSLKSSVQLAAELAVDRKAIDRVRHRETYKDVPDAPPTVDPPAALRRNDYVLGDGLELMGQLPDGYAETVVAMPPLFRPPHANQSQVRKARSGHVDRQKSIIREGLRVAGPNGVLLYVHRYDLTADLLDVGPGGIAEFSPEQVIVWDTMTKEDPPPAPPDGSQVSIGPSTFSAATAGVSRRKSVTRSEDWETCGPSKPISLTGGRWNCLSS